MAEIGPLSRFNGRRNCLDDTLSAVFDAVDAATATGR